jgi:hypothetical protein
VHVPIPRNPIFASLRLGRLSSFIFPPTTLLPRHYHFIILSKRSYLNKICMLHTKYSFCIPFRSTNYPVSSWPRCTKLSTERQLELNSELKPCALEVCKRECPQDEDTMVQIRILKVLAPVSQDVGSLNHWSLVY